MKLLNILLIASIAMSSAWAKEKFFVVERESESLATIYDGLKRTNIEGMHNMNHGVVKFDGKDGYVISRDGYVVKFDPISEKILAEYKTSKSAIGFVIGANYVAVANYDDKSVDILDRDLKPIDKIETNSKNVGIKIYTDYLIFSQMDNDIISVFKDMNAGKGNPNFKLHKEFKDVGELPFDAMIKDEKYIVGFFTSKFFGVVDLEKMEYKKVDVFLDENRQMVLKVPHFGFWSIGGDKIFVPAVGDNKVLVYDNDFKFVKNIQTQGLPVFTSLSPDKKYLAVTYSGKDFPTIQIVDTQTLEIIHTFNFDGKVLHVRWSETSPQLYVSVNDTNKIAVIHTEEWFLNREIFNVKKPSGIFLYEDGK
ncbi:cytochrome d1 heme domain protein, putative heme d1 dehydrogenase NirF [Arcobacter acticola]|uniref:Cytochrome d1 heme domain protein, putative heme d1 dehydrogenase NirF n=1 Tax=Arcobacter acticola TaxID=1849015 RepID=A0A6M8EIJ3_9BACT|nr:cytochrome D1 domain-containing protein [Arcobacter acticola]QKE27759.1 cytochrome d1 heme domain protein, putative heme d1 dehydrogenase NirF [Arcobacter acticola]